MKMLRKLPGQLLLGLTAILFTSIINANAQTALFKDDFKNPATASSWTASSGFYIANGVYNQSETSGIRSAYAGVSKWDNYTLELDMNMDTSGGSSLAHVPSILFRVTDLQNRYEVRLFKNGQLSLRSFVKGVASNLASISTDFNPLDVNAFKIVANGPSIIVSVQGQELINIHNTDHATGYIGLRTRACSALFDNVVVTPVLPALKTSVFLGHSFFRPSAQAIIENYSEMAGIDGKTSQLFFAGGMNGHPLALWKNSGVSAKIKAKLNQGQTQILGMTYFPEKIIGIPLGDKTKDFDKIDGYRNWVKYTLDKGNPLEKVFIAVPWGFYPKTFPLSYRSGAMWNSSRQVIHGIVNQLRKEFPKVEFVVNPYGLAVMELERLFNAKKLNGDVAQLHGVHQSSVYKDDPIGHAGLISDRISTLMWLHGIFKADIDSIDFGYTTDLNQIVKDITEKYTTDYPGYSGLE